MVAQDENVDELHLVYKVVLSLREDVKGVNEKCDDLGKQMGEFTAFMIRAKALDEARDLPTEIKSLTSRVQTLETAREKDQATTKGQWSVWGAVVALTAFIALLVSLALALKDLFGGK